MILPTLLLIVSAAVLAAVATRRPGESAMARFFGGLLLGVGLIIALASGLCTAGWLIMMFNQRVTSASAATERVTALGLASVFGGVPFIVGGAMIIAGVLILRRPRPPRSQ